MQDVPAYAARAGLVLDCYYDKEPAVLAASHEVRVGYEAYFFCSEEHVERFQRNLIEHCGLVTDPVTKERFRPAFDSPLSLHEEVLYLFSTESSAETFAANPEAYVRPGWKMAKKPEAESTAESQAEVGVPDNTAKPPS